MIADVLLFGNWRLLHFPDVLTAANLHLRTRFAKIADTIRVEK